MFFVIGGNGSHAGATAIYEQVAAKHNVTILNA
jgi:6-phosphofructokinase